MKITDEMIEAACANYFGNWKSMGQFQASKRIRSNFRAALKAALAAVDQEPVAWRYRFKDSAADDWSGVTLEQPNAGQIKHFIIDPLYATPPVQGEGQ
jgi:hypothetical protein